MNTSAGLRRADAGGLSFPAQPELVHEPADGIELVLLRREHRIDVRTAFTNRAAKEQVVQHVAYGVVGRLWKLGEVVDGLLAQPPPPPLRLAADGRQVQAAVEHVHHDRP